MVSVNGNYDKGNYFFTKDIVKKEIKEDKVEKAVVEEKQQEFKERGEELLTAGMYGKTINMLTLKNKLDQETADELSEMFAMAGISHRLPTASEYARIAGSTKTAMEQFTSFETEKHIEMLFNSKAMDFLAEETLF
ncbi:MAG: hypothetical protein NC390_05785 [Fusobacterium sp.]|nr:hypothetical protein [Fusobacterium sp.]